MPRSRHAPERNTLLAKLAEKDYRRFVENCDVMELVFSDVLMTPGALIRHVYFPIRSFISLTTQVDGHANLEVGMIGHEGMLGASLVLDVDVSPWHALVQGAGSALRMDAALFRREFRHGVALQHLLRRYISVQMRQLAQEVVCTRHHVAKARLARWLLMTQDRAHSDELHMTQEFLSYMLGVRRVGITKAATALQSEGLISYHRGKLTILDQRGLEAASCHCYAIDKASYEQTMHA